jgi:hypothetical protein
MAQLTQAQLAALDLLIAQMTADKIETAQINADYTDAIANVFDAYANAVAHAADVYANAVAGAADAAAHAAERVFGVVVLPAERAEALREKLEGRAPPSLEELIALRSLHS